MLIFMFFNKNKIRQPENKNFVITFEIYILKKDCRKHSSASNIY